MKIERAIEILDPEHREHYDGLEEVSEACRMGMNALKMILSGELVRPVRCIECEKLGYKDFRGICEGGPVCGPIEPRTYCAWGERKEDPVEEPLEESPETKPDPVDDPRCAGCHCLSCDMRGKTACLEGPKTCQECEREWITCFCPWHPRENGGRE